MTKGKAKKKQKKGATALLLTLAFQGSWNIGFRRNRLPAPSSTAVPSPTPQSHGPAKSTADADVTGVPGGGGKRVEKVVEGSRMQSTAFCSRLPVPRNAPCRPPSGPRPALPRPIVG